MHTVAQAVFDEAVKTNMEDFDMEVRTAASASLQCSAAGRPHGSVAGHALVVVSRCNCLSCTRHLRVQADEAVKSAVEEFELQVGKGGSAGFASRMQRQMGLPAPSCCFSKAHLV